MPIMFYKIENGSAITGSGIAAPDGFTVYVEGKEPAELVAALAPKLETVRTTKLAEINNGYSSVMAYIQAGYPLDEVLSWERQASQARELLVNSEAEAVFVRVLASQKGVPVPEMRDRILRNATNWELTAARLTAQRQIMEERTYMATTIEEIEAIKVGYSV